MPVQLLPHAAPQLARPPSAQDTGYHHEHHCPGSLDIFVVLRPPPRKDSPLSLLLRASDFGFHLRQVHLIGHVWSVCPCASCKGEESIWPSGLSLKAPGFTKG